MRTFTMEISKEETNLRKILSVWSSEWNSKVSSFEALDLEKWMLEIEGNVMIFQATNVVVDKTGTQRIEIIEVATAEWRWEPRIYDYYSCVLATSPHQWQWGTLALGIAGKKINWIWDDTVCVCVCDAIRGSTEESLPDKIRKRERSRGRKKRGDCRRFYFRFFSKHSIHDSRRVVTFALFPLGHPPSPHPHPI